VHCVLGNAEEIAEGTALGRFDLGLVTGEVKLSLQEHLQQEAVGRERLRIVVGQDHPWFEQETISTHQLPMSSWVMRESGSGAQQMFEQALHQWQVELPVSQASRHGVPALVLSSSEMVKAVVERGIGAAALPELMIEKELKLGTLWAVQVVDADSSDRLEIVQPILKLKHQKRFQTQIIAAFERLLSE